MWPPVISMILCGCLCSLLAAVSASVPIVYKKVGDEVVLKPDVASLVGPITSIMWKAGRDIAIQWDGGDIEYYRYFQVRGELNISSGEMTITGLTQEDSRLYTPEINNKLYSATELKVISAVPIPTVSESCDVEKTSCILTCDGNITDADLVTYKWKFDDSPGASLKTHTITKESSSHIKEFSCELENPVSKESSQPIPNPLISSGDSTSEPEKTEGSLKINTGLTVFICLLTVVVLLGLIHRWKAGMWFFQKASMPWEADFWRKDRQPTAAVESNGTTANQENIETSYRYVEAPMAPSKP